MTRDERAISRILFYAKDRQCIATVNQNQQLIDEDDSETFRCEGGCWVWVK